MPYAPYTQTTFVNNSTPAVNATNLNHVESGIRTRARPMYLQVASVDAPADFKDGADYVCDGTNDQTEINTALDRAAPLQSRNAGMPAAAEQLGQVVLSGGRFTIAGSTGIRQWTGTRLSGQGRLTEILSNGCTAPGLINLADNEDHLVEVCDMFLNGNGSGGGSCNGLDFDMTDSASTAGYPDSNADANHSIHDLWIDNFTSADNRTLLKVWSAASAKNRGSIIDRIQGRDCTGHGIELSAASDCFVSNCHIAGGTGSDTGYKIATGNTKIANCKAFFFDVYGLHATSGRGTITGFESQDNDTGMYFDASPWAGSAITVDTSLTAGLRIGTSQLVMSGFTIFVRSGGRYATQAIGLHIDASHADCIITGEITPANITTKISGTIGSRSFLRVTDGSTLVSAG